MAGLTSKIEEYEFTHKYRGLALIFIHEEFDDPQTKTRKGADKDQEKMYHLFKNLDFKVKVYRDLTAKQIKEKLQKAADSKYNVESDCFVCVFSTHGTEEKKQDWKLRTITWRNAVYGRDCQPILVDDILNMFSNKNCPGLADKPKLFFIQACRSRHEQKEDHILYDSGCLVKLMKTNQQRKLDHGDGNQRDEVDEQGPSGQSIVEGLTDATLKLGIQETGDPGPQYDPTDLKYDDIYADWIEDKDPDDISDFRDLQKAQGEDNNDDEDDDVDEEDEENMRRGIEDDIARSPDKPDAGGSGDSSAPPERIQEFTPINCPNDCLVLYPVMPGRIALRSKEEGSWMLHFMHLNLRFLLRHSLLMPYLTKVCADVAARTFYPAPLNKGIVDQKSWIETKAAAHIVHRLSKNVRFVPKKSNSLMAIWFNALFPKFKMKFKNQ